MPSMFTQDLTSCNRTTSPIQTRGKLVYTCIVISDAPLGMAVVDQITAVVNGIKTIQHNESVSLAVILPLGMAVVDQISRVVNGIKTILHDLNMRWIYYYLLA